MKLGVSQLAFKSKPLVEILKKIESSPIKGLEIAPTLIWKEPTKSTPNERQKVKDLFSDDQIEVIGFQSLLFGQPHLKIFESAARRLSCLDYLKHMLEVCHDVGGRLISFGSPQNRKRGDLDMARALELAIPFFRDLASAAKDWDIMICFEPIAAEFGCDFINTAEEGHELVERVGHSHFRLLLDTGNLAMNRESFSDAFKRSAGLLQHVQVNDPQLTPPGSKEIDHREISEILKAIGYQGWVTMECFLKDESSFRELRYAIDCYHCEDSSVGKK